jgi:uncharacterized protein (UPF0548 family)
LFSLASYSENRVQQFISEQRLSCFSYREVGATRGELPASYNVDHNRILLGEGEPAWNRAVSALKRWEMFHIPWIRLYWPTSQIRIGTDVAVEVRHYGFCSLNACRIVYVVDEPGTVTRYGFAYGTLREHAESGEERFTVEWDKVKDEVWYDILAFSRPHKFLAKLAYPLSRSLQRRFAAASKQAMVNACLASASVGMRNDQ